MVLLLSVIVLNLTEISSTFCNRTLCETICGMYTVLKTVHDGFVLAAVCSCCIRKLEVYLHICSVKAYCPSLMLCDIPCPHKK